MTFISNSMSPAAGIRRKSRDVSPEKIVFTLDAEGNPVRDDAPSSPRRNPRGGYHPYQLNGFTGGVQGMAWPGMLMDIRV